MGDTLNIKDKRDKLEKLTLNMNVSNSGIIYQLLNSKSIDRLFKNITDEKTYIEGKSLIKKKYLNGDEQFIIVLNHFITFFEYHFPTISYKDLHIGFILEYINPEFLFCKKCCEDNETNDYYQLEMKKAIIYNFYDNIQYLYSENDRKFWDRVKIKKDMDLNNNECVEIIFNFLKKVAFANINEYSTIYLFDNYRSYLKKIDPKGKNKTCKNILKAFDETKKHYGLQYSTLLNNYIKKEDYLDKIM